jgi:hypothetical protein
LAPALKAFLAPLRVALDIPRAGAEGGVCALAGAADARTTLFERARRSLVDRRACSRIVDGATVIIDVVARRNDLAPEDIPVTDSNLTVGKVGQVIAFDRGAALVIADARAGLFIPLGGAAGTAIAADEVEIAHLAASQADPDVAP